MARARSGWPVHLGGGDVLGLARAAGADGNYHIDSVTGPDEENPNVNDEAYTNVGAKTHDAGRDRGGPGARPARAGRAGRRSPPASWCRSATRGIHPEFSGYQGQLVKQADVTLLQYPWEFPMPAAGGAEATSTTTCPAPTRRARR